MTDDAIEIRTAGPGDLDAIALLHHAAYAGQPSLLLQLGPRATRATYRWFLGAPGGFALLATVNDRPGGFLLGMHGPLAESAFGKHRMRALLPVLLRRPGVLYAALRSRTGDRGSQHEARGTASIIHSLAVEPRFQGRKLGKRLLDAVSEEARSAGMSHVRAAVGRQNRLALRLYHADGFHQIGVLEGSDQFMLEKALA